MAVHRLVQSIAVSSMTKDVQLRLFNQVLSLLNKEFPREISGQPTWNDWDRCNSYLPHVLFIRGKWQELFEHEQKNAELASLLSACTWYVPFEVWVSVNTLETYKAQVYGRTRTLHGGGIPSHDCSIRLP